MFAPPPDQWVRRYNGPGNGHDSAYALAVDGLGNVYVTGGSRGDGTEDDYATIKYNAAGTLQWVRRYNGPGNGHDSAYALAVDGLGNVYVTGQSFGSGSKDDYATIKYDTNGKVQWVRRFNGPASASDVATALALDSLGNVYVTGYATGSNKTYDYATVKYDANGNRKWVCAYDGPGKGNDFAFALAVDSLGNVYVTGQSAGLTTGPDYATLKYDTNGALKWVRRHSGPVTIMGSFDRANALALHGGGVYVTGASVSSDFDTDYVTLLYDTNGNLKWKWRYNGPANGMDEASALAVDGSGNVYVTGYSGGDGTGEDYATIKYNAAGIQQWVQRYNGPGNSDDLASALAVDGSGNVYVTGYSGGDGTDIDYTTIKYSPSGKPQWVRRYNGPGNRGDMARALALGAQEYVYVTGASEGLGTSGDYGTIKYRP
jgi:hypothetical protein